MQTFEEQIRVFVVKWQERDVKAVEEGFLDVDSDDLDSEDEEIVFVGRSGQMKDETTRRERRELEEKVKKELLVFESEEGEDRGKFA